MRFGEEISLHEEIGNDIVRSFISFSLTPMTDTATIDAPLVPPSNVENLAESTPVIFESKKPGAWAKVYRTTSQEGKPAVYCRYDTYRKISDNEYIHNSFLNSFDDCENLVFVVNECLDFMRDFYNKRDA